MAERRSLVEGLDTIETDERTLEEHFVYGRKPRRAAPPPPPAADASPPVPQEPPARPPAEPPARATEKPKLAPLTGIGRVPVGARIRTELAAALKRASLERQLQGLEPNSLQDILEEALEPWLRKHGHLK